MFIKRTLAAGGVRACERCCRQRGKSFGYGWSNRPRLLRHRSSVELDPMSAHLVDSHSDLLATPVSKQASIS